MSIAGVCVQPWICETEWRMRRTKKLSALELFGQRDADERFQLFPWLRWGLRPAFAQVRVVPIGLQHVEMHLPAILCEKFQRLLRCPEGLRRESDRRVLLLVEMLLNAFVNVYRVIGLPMNKNISTYLSLMSLIVFLDLDFYRNVMLINYSMNRWYKNVQ